MQPGPDNDWRQTHLGRLLGHAREEILGKTIADFIPAEDVVRLAGAREGLLAGGDLAWAGYTYHSTLPYLLDSAPSLDEYVAEGHSTPGRLASFRRLLEAKG